jgi:hypothetical protein
MSSALVRWNVLEESQGRAADDKSKSDQEAVKKAVYKSALALGQTAPGADPRGCATITGL